MKDISKREDIEFLVNDFYDKVVKDDLIGFFFTDVAKVDLNNHLPKMYNFWESILLGNPTYSGQPMLKHFPINEVAAMEETHFQRWLEIWEKTIRKNFKGQNSEIAVSRALNIARIMHLKMYNARK